METLIVSQDVYKRSRDHQPMEQSTNQSINQQINRLSNAKLLQQVLAFQSPFFNFSTLFPSFSQVSVNFLA